jgi:geranylgeranyl diphosphate synthase type II
MNKYYELYINYKTQIDERLFNFIEKENPKSLYEPLKYILSGGGKRIRPMVLIFSCEALGGKIENSIDAAVAIELLHNFTLVHDDIMDNAATRRGRKTIHEKWDANIAILAGDELIGLAYKSLLKTNSVNIAGIAREFTEAIIEVCEGQSYDKEFENRDNVTVDEYLMMIEKKTSKLLEMSAAIGALIANGTDEQIRHIRDYALNIGLAFQIQDDLLDIIADEETFGKKNGGDIVEGKKTFLLLKANEIQLNDNEKKLIDEVIVNKPGRDVSYNGILRIKKIYEDNGIIDSAQKEIEKYTHNANSHLEKLGSSEAKDMLMWFSQMLLSRNF